jgi:hypothetical protein
MNPSCAGPGCGRVELYKITDLTHFSDFFRFHIFTEEVTEIFTEKLKDILNFNEPVLRRPARLVDIVSLSLSIYM